MHSDVLDLPDNEIACAAVDLVRHNESAPIANHSIRSYLFARLVAAHRGLRAGRDFTADLLFFACVLHDIGLSELGDRAERFEVAGADIAAEFLTGRGLDADSIDVVWQAIALHTSPGIAERRGPVCALTRDGIGLDFGRGAGIVDVADAARIHDAYPRLAMARSLIDVVVAQAGHGPDKAPRYTFPGELLRERTETGTTALEAQAAASRWGS